MPLLSDWEVAPPHQTSSLQRGAVPPPSPDWSPSCPSPPGPALLGLPVVAPTCQLLPLPASGRWCCLFPEAPSWGFSLRDKQHIRHLTNRCHPRPCPASTSWSRRESTPLVRAAQPMLPPGPTPKAAQSPRLEQATGRGSEACLRPAPPQGSRGKSSLPH